MKRIAFTLALAAFTFVGGAAVAGHDSKSCGSECKNCADVCQKTLDYCVKKGGAHAKSEHVNLMKDCIAVCKTNAELRSRSSKYADELAKLCSKICTDCSASCESLKDPKMKDCVDTCRKCAECCSH